MQDPLEIVKEADKYREQEGDIQKGITLLEKNLKELEKDPIILSFYIPLFLKKLGNFYRDIGDTKRAKELYQNGLEVAKNDLNRMEEADILVSMAFLELKTGTAKDALKYALKAWEYIGPKRGGKFAEIKVNTLAVLGNIHFEQADLEEALRRYERALRISEKYKIKKRIITVSGDIANVYIMLKEEEKALRILEKVLPLAEELYQVALPQIHMRIGKLNMAKRNYEKAKGSFRVALDISETMGLSRDIGESYENLGDVSALEDSHEAKIYYEKALTQYKKSGLSPHVESANRKLKTV
jgi:tetratricopeptide (TPR) repeat protein